jgi:hypothetical protein
MPRFSPLAGFVGLAVMLTSNRADSQEAAGPAEAPTVAVDSFTAADRVWISGQANVIAQLQPSFAAKYSGPNSLLPQSERASSSVLTVYGGVRWTRGLSVLFDVERVGGGGLSDAHGLGGAANVDATPTGTYVARAMLHYTIPLTAAMTLVTRNPLSLASAVPERRVELRAGKMSAVDFFDLNSIGSDSHLQFTNAAIVNNGTYDYASDAYGYAYGVMAEYDDRQWSLRFAELYVPASPPNVPDFYLGGGGNENLEVEFRSAPLKLPSVVRALAYVTRANAARYQDAIAPSLIDGIATPDTHLWQKPGTATFGIGINAEHQLTGGWRLGWRFGWNDGNSEATPIDRTVQAASDIAGTSWGRPSDKIGAAFVANGLSRIHVRYLQLGGEGMGLGDGTLNYGSERTFEAYYNARLWRGLSLGIDYQRVTYPGYNRDRGPASVFGLRFHFEEALPVERF